MLNVNEVQEMDFSTVVGITNEPNTPSGGAQTIRRILQQVPLHAGHRILDVGCNTGFASVEFANWTEAEVIGIDVNPTSLDFAEQKARSADLANVHFEKVNALKMPFSNGAFNLVYCNNVTSFISERGRAVAEYYRVLCARGVLAAVPIYYFKAPPDSLRRQVEQAIGAALPVRGKQFWYDQFASAHSVLYFDEDYEYVYQTPDRIREYLTCVMSQPHLAQYPEHLRIALSERLGYFYTLFNENLTFARFCILLYQYQAPNPEPILFQARRLGEASDPV